MRAFKEETLEDKARRSPDNSREPKKGQPATKLNLKRGNFLARNRLAASKCRTKKKERTICSEMVAWQVSLQSRELHVNIQCLRSEVLEYKMQLNNNIDCDCDPIKLFWQKEKQEDFSVVSFQGL